MLTNYRKDNMERMPYEYYAGEYRKADPLEISSRLGIPFDMEKQEFMLMFLGELYRITYPDFKVSHEGKGALYDTLEGDIYAKILVLRYLLHASVFPHNGDFRAYRELPSGDLYYRQFQGRCMFRLNRKYGSRPEVLKRIAGEMGAVTIEGADYGFEVELFENLYVRFLLWEGDDEFPASSQILFSSNFPAAFGTYDLAEIVEICIHTFAETEKRLEGDKG